jgi:hypothetical protein
MISVPSQRSRRAEEEGRRRWSVSTFGDWKEGRREREEYVSSSSAKGAMAEKERRASLQTII